MKNYIHKLAIDNINKNKKFYKHIFISMFFAFFMVIFTCILSCSLDKYDYEKRAYTHGKWDVFVEYLNDEKMDILDNLRYCSKKGELFIGGVVVFNDQDVGYIGYYDDIGYELANLHYLQGREAQTADEVVVEESLFLLMNLQMNQNIELNYEVDNQIKTKTYKLVGVVEDYTYYWNIQPASFISDVQGLSFITKEMDSYDTNILLKASSTLLLWNEIQDSGILDVQFNTYNYPHYEWTNLTFTNESPLLGYAMEMILFSFIAIITSIMCSLEKRESQFVLFRCIGMTYKQLKKLIIYEGYILACIGFMLAGVVSIILSMIVMGVYALLSGNTFAWDVDLLSLGIQLAICIFVMYIGIILPTLTVYSLPLTSKKGEYYYHLKKRKIRKLTINSFVKNKLLNNKVYSSFIYIILCFVLFRGFMMVDKTINYYQNKNVNHYNYDYVWSTGNLKLDLSPLLNDEEIHIAQSKCYSFHFFQWDDMEKEISTIALRRGTHVNGSIVSVQNDYEVVNYLKEHGYEVMNELGDYEAVVIIPNRNYAVSLNDSYKIDTVKEKNGLYAEDIGLSENNNIYIYEWIEDEAYKTLAIDKVIRIDGNSIRDYFDCYTVIVNEKTYKELTTYDHDNYYVFKTDSDVAASQVQRLYYSTRLSLNHLSSEFIYGFSLKDIIMDQINEADILKTEYYNAMIHDCMMNFVYIFLIYVMRILSVDKEKKMIHLFRNVGMTKKDTYFINIMYSSIIFIFSLISVFIVWIFWYKVSFGGFINVFSYLNTQSVLYVIICCVVFVVYLIFMLLPIKNVLKENPLNFMK